MDRVFGRTAWSPKMIEIIFFITRPNKDNDTCGQIETKYFRVSRNHVIFAGLRSMTNDQVTGVV